MVSCCVAEPTEGSLKYSRVLAYSTFHALPLDEGLWVNLEDLAGCGGILSQRAVTREDYVRLG